MIRFKDYLQEEDENYKMQHEAPDKENGAPLYDVTLNDIYPKDFYDKSNEYIGDEEFDYESASIIHSVHNRPNKLVTVYRAVPDINYEVNSKISELNSALYYKQTHNFFPSSFKRGYDYFKELQKQFAYTDKFKSYDEWQEYLIKKIEERIEKLAKQKKTSIKINNGDWVTINRRYAVAHGKDNVGGKYKILSKTVKAKDLYVEGNSLSEQGYFL